MTETRLADLSAFAETLADMARTLARQHFRKTFAFERKADESPVTAADKAIESALRTAIEERYPEHGIFGEETGRTGSQDRVWVLDPIDGTKSFITGMPLFGTLIAFVEGGATRLGAIEMPALGERWIAVEGRTTMNGAPARTSGCTQLADARVFTTSPDYFVGEDWPRFDRVSRLAAMRRYGADCYQYALLASGFCDLVIETGLQPYDYMALGPVIEGAGGVMTDWEGRALSLDCDGRVIAAATPALHEAALAELWR
ncbi:histidinol-phosphatase [Aurantimonas sp. Leaf443]|uniref:histidinol-phosphatase n=1 Tax=Aurantimonas sp. Leaf443 TaxID=1736378 RepID=UPI0006F82951|nr:histidinol-phosphatase [Aurantimonas sp. Leaf443]KQT85281.1 histidinol phosphate phosphatase [Aurantimonas sp. Leaf443]